MASMAAAIAASRSAVMSGNRPLDDRERKRFTYFSSLSPMARKIMQDKEKIREKYGPEWARLPPAQQDEIIDRCLVGPSVPAPRAPGNPGDPAELARFPGLRGPTGQKVVRFGDEVGAPARRDLPEWSRPPGRGGGGWSGERSSSNASRWEGRPRPQLGWGASQEFGESGREEVFRDPLSRASPLGRTGAEGMLFSEADQSRNSRNFKPDEPWVLIHFATYFRAVGELNVLEPPFLPVYTGDNNTHPMLTKEGTQQIIYINISICELCGQSEVAKQVTRRKKCLPR